MRFAPLIAVVFLAALACLAEERVTPADIPTRIATAQIGEWALYRLADGNRLRLTVVEETGAGRARTLVVERRLMDARNRTLGVAEESVNVEDAVWDLVHLSPGDTLERADVLVGTRRLSAVVITYHRAGGPALQSYLSDKVPVHGLIKGLELGPERKVAMQLIEHGFADD